MMWLRKDRAGFFFKKKLDQPSSHFPETSSALCACKASQGLMKCSLNPVPRLLHALQFFLFSFSSGVHQYHSNVCLIRPTKTNGDNGATQMTDRRLHVVAQSNWVHITAETCITKLSPEMLTENSPFFHLLQAKKTRTVEYLMPDL